MHKQQLPETAKLRDTKITSLHSLHTIVSVNTNTDMRFIKHHNIVGAITNS